jgi:hypothetical protein
MNPLHLEEFVHPKEHVFAVFEEESFTTDDFESKNG